MINANGADSWGSNFVATNFPYLSGTSTGFASFSATAIEADVYINGASGLTGKARGLAIYGAMGSIPSGGAYGIEMGGVGSDSLGWSAGIVIDDQPGAFQALS